jgi:hypothetical protein
VLLAFDPATGRVVPAAGAGGLTVVAGTAWTGAAGAGAAGAAARAGGLGM